MGKSSFQQWVKFNKKRLLDIEWILPVVLLGLIFFFFTLSNVYTQIYDIEKFSNADETIVSPITIENKKETDRKIRKALHEVEDRYTISSEVTSERTKLVQDLFDAIENVNQTDTWIQPGEAEASTTSVTIDDRLDKLYQLVTGDVIDSLDSSTLRHLISANEQDRKVGSELLLTSLYNEFNQGIRSDTLEQSKSNIKSKLMYSSLSTNYKSALTEVGRAALIENSFYDPDKTAEARTRAQNNVQPEIIRAGDVIVLKGQEISNEIYDKLDLVGLLTEKRNTYPIIGLAILIGILLLGVGHELKDLYTNSNFGFKKSATIVLVSIMILTIMKLLAQFQDFSFPIYYVVPAASAAFLLKILVNERIALLFAVVYSILGSLLFNNFISGNLNMEATLYLFFTQLAGIVFLKNLRDRLSIIKAGIGLSLVNMGSTLIFFFFTIEGYQWLDLILHLGMGFLSAFLSVILTLGVLPVLEMSFGMLTDTRLITLSNPNHPLLRKILTETPGTYHHSVMVANLSESACEAIGANGLLARVGSYYHDLGKTVQPMYFIENQMGIQNPHDYLDPEESAQIIISHPYLGADLLRKNKLPKEIVDIAEQHHGTTLLKYFYYKEKEKKGKVKESDFRYPGPKPRSKEAAIVCICDSVEAAVRSMKEPSMEKIESLVESIIQDRLEDGQFDETSLTISDLRKTKVAICETLKGIFHSRIQYPKANPVKEAN